MDRDSDKLMSVVQLQSIDRDSNFLLGYSNLFVKQTRKGWLMELCLGCDANTEFKIATMEDQRNDILYATENTSCCIRMWCGSLRPFEITVSAGGVAGGQAHAVYERPFACHMHSMKCCCFQEIEAKNPDGSSLGKVKEDFWFCVPSFQVLKDETTVQYNIHMPTCCGGMCVDVCSEGCCSCRIPFNIYEPGNSEKGSEVGKIVKVWSGLGTELFTDADKFELIFPRDADGATKARLLGATFLINQLFFEGKKKSAGAPN